MLYPIKYVTEWLGREIWGYAIDTIYTGALEKLNPCWTNLSWTLSHFLYSLSVQRMSRHKEGLSTTTLHYRVICELHQGCILKSNPHVVCCLALLCTHWNHSKQCFSMPHAPPMSLEVFWRSEERHTTVGLVILHKVTMVILYVLYVLMTLYKTTDRHWETKPFLTVWNIGRIMIYVSTGLFIQSTQGGRNREVKYSLGIKRSHLCHSLRFRFHTHKMVIVVISTWQNYLVNKLVNLCESVHHRGDVQ